MKNLVIIFAFLSTFSLAGWAQQEAFSTEKADEILQKNIQKHGMVGIVAGVYKDGKVVWQNGAGYRDREAKIAANAQMLNRTASISKPMTAIAILQLFEQKKLGLDDPVQKYLPYFPKKKKGTITIRHLLHHISGIGAYQKRKNAFNTKNYPTLEEAIGVFKNRKLLNKPGEAYHYTTYGYVVLGAIVEKASGMTYRDYMKKNIWDKAGMTHTDVEVFGQSYNNKAKLYRKTRKGEIVEDKNTDLSIKVPGGGVQSTVGDLLKFGQAILEHKLIKPATFQMMITPSGIKKRGNPYAMGWFVYGRKDQPSGLCIGHSGSQSGTSTQLLIYLDKKTVVATLCNTAGVWPQVVGLTVDLAMTTF
ncbi:hypothetical protein BKI52_11190 [marine bacterium AO1-C]|nr:hypothetical protein BKI52_11190 [marine bacterium AO1-C]